MLVELLARFAAKCTCRFAAEQPKTNICRCGYNSAAFFRCKKEAKPASSIMGSC